MKIFYSDHFTLPLPPNHRFPIPKYALLRERVLASAFPPPVQLLVSPPAADAEILRVHTPEYWEKVKTGALDEKEIRRIGFPWSPGLVERTRRSVGGTIAACRAILPNGSAAPVSANGLPPISANLAGGTHHAYPDHGEGFCVLNDVAIAARAMLAEERARHLVIIDCDVHQGNGTAAIFRGDPHVYTFSIHAEKNFPAHKETSHLDIGLADGCTDAEYLSALLAGLEIAIEDSRADLALYIAGADPFAGDRLGRLSLTKPGLLERDRMVFDLCRSSGIPVVIVMGGGYGRQIEDTVDIQYQTVRLAVEMSL
jgi:acetoin utilization deacetylase AcuC-like enzyme